VLFVGNDWAEDHHDVEIVDEQDRRLARRRIPEGLAGVTGLHALIAQFVPDEWGALDPAEAASRVKVGIETDRGQWVQALLAGGYDVFAIKPLSVARYRERHSIPVPNRMPVMRMCWPRSCAWTGRITARSPGTPS
jgi:transposase